MSSICIRGGYCLNGEVDIQGAKNAALPIMAASLLNKGIVCLRRCPQISDVRHMCRLLEQMGVRIETDGDRLILDTKEIDPIEISAPDAGKMRSSVQSKQPVNKHAYQYGKYQYKWKNS